MNKFSVTGVTTDAPAPAPPQDAAFRPSVETNVLIPRQQALTWGALVGLISLLVWGALLLLAQASAVRWPWYGLLVLAGLAVWAGPGRGEYAIYAGLLFGGLLVFALDMQPGWLVYALLALGGLLMGLGTTLVVLDQKQRVIEDIMRKREVALGVDLNGDGYIGAPHPPVWSNNRPPADDALLRERAKMRAFVQALYDAGTSYNALRGAGFTSDADIRSRLVELQQGGVLKLVKRGQRDTVELLLDRAEALERLDRAKFMDD